MAIPPSRPPLVATARACPEAPGLLEALDRVGSLPGAFLRWVAGSGFRGPAWSILSVAQEPVRTPPRWPRGLSLAEALAPLAPRLIRRLGARVPFAGGWVGYLGYEARSGVERTPAPRRSPLGFPALWLGWAPAALLHEHRSGTTFVTGLGHDLGDARRAADALLELVLHTTPRTRRAGRGAAVRARPVLTPTTYQAQVATVRRHVRAGDIFQANLSQRFDAVGVDEPVTLFRRLVEQQPAPYMTYLRLPGGRAVLSASPERFLRVEGALVATDPMKGTRPRGATRATDLTLARALEASEKDRAELAMIVDLSRNDLARVCRPGSVRVRVPRRLIPFARVHQAIAVVEGRLAAGRTRVDLLQAAFPPGSVTGAPKVRAMEVIDALEGEGRGPYCGAIGWFDAGGDMDLAVAIRTLLLAKGRASYRVGGGVTLRSAPAEEWRETLAKGRGLAAALARGKRR